jgi:signal transduction histidine kinase
MSKTGDTLGRRLLLAQGAVISAMALTMAGVAVLVGPPLFHAHMLEAGHVDPSPVVEHAELAFRNAGLISLGVGLGIAVLGALAVILLLNRRIGRSLTALTSAAEQVSGGDYDIRIAEPGVGSELSALAGAFNEMAARLQATEATRRRLLTDLAHEMRTPVATIDVCLEGLEDGILRLDETTIRTFREQTARLARLTEGIRDVSAAEEGRLDLRTVTTSAHDVLERAYLAAKEAFSRKGVALTLRAPAADYPMLLVDPERIAQVLSNLLSNALRHTPPGGTVRLRTVTVDHIVQLLVEDDGEGIPLDALPHVFERFYRVDTARDRGHGGTGVGLAISQAIAHAHHGKIDVASDGPGRGATFTLSLPRT